MFVRPASRQVLFNVVVSNGHENACNGGKQNATQTTRHATDSFDMRCKNRAKQSLSLLACGAATYVWNKVLSVFSPQQTRNASSETQTLCKMQQSQCIAPIYPQTSCCWRFLPCAL
jgi:hypothetical protein